MDNNSVILVCALQLFSQKGYNAVGVQEIVDAAGITKPTLYHYFGSKRGLLDSLLAEYMTGFFRVIEPAAEYDGDITNTLNKITFAYFNYAQKHKQFYRLALSSWFAPPDSEVFNAILPYMQRQQKLMEEVFLNAAKQHGNMKNRHEVYAYAFLGMINTYIGITLNGVTKIDENTVYRVVHHYMHGIFS